MNLSLLYPFRTKTFGLTTSQSNFLFLNGHPNHLKCCIHPWHRCHCTQVCKMSVTRMYTFCYSSNEQTVKVWAVASFSELKVQQKGAIKGGSLTLFASKAKINVYFFLKKQVQCYCFFTIVNYLAIPSFPLFSLFLSKYLVVKRTNNM